MPIYYSLLAAVLPFLLYIFLIWKFDKYGKEPVKPAVICFLWGAFGAVFFAFLGNAVFTFLFSVFTKNKNAADVSGTIIGAPLIEEFTKGLFLFFMFSKMKFENVTDGIIYGGAIGLGFGMTENFLYFFSFGKDLNSWLSIVIVRTLFSAAMHCSATASLGAFLGYSKFSRAIYRFIIIPTGFLLAVFIHFTWNLCISFQATYLLGIVFMIVITFILTLTYWFSVKNEEQTITEEINNEIHKGLLPFENLLQLFSNENRGNNMLNKRLLKELKNSIVTLAFRKKQLSAVSEKYKAKLNGEIENLRNNIFTLLNKNNGN